MRSRELVPAVLQMLEARSAGRTMELMVTDSDVVEQAKGFLREILDISVEDAYGLLRRYAQVHGDQRRGPACQGELSPLVHSKSA